ncbi:MAG: hypothetical protein GXO66_07405 [Euryarchaeota archaeon]|nr:hypothetical protein [Euryarchaeota archaeon]
MPYSRVVTGAIFLLLLAGCASGENKPASGAVAPQAKEPQPAETETQEEVLHGVGRCDQCHEALTLEEIRGGVHEQGFALFEGHREFCRECHDVEETCTQCHGMPDVAR